MIKISPLLFVLFFVSCRNNSAVRNSENLQTESIPAKNIKLIDAENFRRHWSQFVSLKLTKCERVMFGGFKRVEFTLYNDSPYVIDSVSIRVNYLEEKKLYKYGYATAIDIEQGESLILDAPFSSRGDSLNYSIEYLKADEAKLHYKRKNVFNNL